MAKVKVVKEDKKGRNQKFRLDMTRSQFVKKIKKGEMPNYHIRVINGVETPCSNPNSKQSDNLG